MITVLFIASSARSAQISTHLQAVLDARIEFVDDIDLGLKLVFDKRPQVVCIEDEIAGVSGESVAQHIRLLLGGAAPGIILLHDSSIGGNQSETFSAVIDITQPPGLLSDAVLEALQSLLKEHWHLVWNVSKADSQKMSVECPQTGDNTYVDAESKASAAVNRLPGTQELLTQRDDVSISSADAGRSLQESAVSVTEELLQAFENNYQSSWGSSKMLRGVLVLGVLAIVVSIWAWYTTGKNSDIQTPAASSGGTDKQQAAIITLSFIPATANQDTAFSRQQPGWSRYIGGGREYRVFRSDGSVKAVQVIALEPPSLQARELSAVLIELLGTVQYRTTRIEQKGELTLEHAVGGQGAELLLYKASSIGAEMRAFVLVMGN